jgi:putative spermidine/putrescine transport system substrate-binding protein
MYKWMDYITSPEVQAQVAYWFGEAPANPKACALITDDATHCDVYHATDEDFYNSLYFWATPRRECLDGSGSDCVPFSEWIKAWTSIKG